MEDMEKAREKARQWEQVHKELLKLPRCHRHGTVGFFVEPFTRVTIVLCFFYSVGA